MKKEIRIKTDYITLSQLLKLADLIQSGGEAKYFLSEAEVIINGEIDNRRGRKLYDQDIIIINNKEYIITNDNK